jgi:hypothetical protein
LLPHQKADASLVERLVVFSITYDNQVPHLPGEKEFASWLAPDVVVEWAAIHVAERWTYALRRHVIPAFNIDLLP